MTLLRNRGFMLLNGGQFLTFVADWGLRTLLLIWTFGLTHSGFAVGLVGMAEAVPLLLLAPVAGVFVDRWDRAGTMTGAALLRVVALVPLLLIQTRAGMPIIVIVTLLMNVASQFFVPAAQAALPSVVSTDEIGRANSAISLGQGAIAVLSPAGAAVLFATVGPHAALVAFGSLYLVAAPLLFAVPGPRPMGIVDATGTPEKSIHAAASVFDEMREGMRYVRHFPLLLTLVGLAFTVMLSFGALSVLDIVFVTRALHRVPSAVGLLYASSGLGEFLSGIVVFGVATWFKMRYERAMGIAILVCGAGFACVSVSQSLVIAAAFQFAVGTTFPVMIVAFTTLVQTRAEESVLGRVLSLLNAAVGAGMILSTTGGGALADILGVRQVMGLSALILLVAGGVSLWRVKPADTAAGHHHVQESVV